MNAVVEIQNVAAFLLFNQAANNEVGE